jgi:hypothetical protein
MGLDLGFATKRKRSKDYEFGPRPLGERGAPVQLLIRKALGRGLHYEISLRHLSDRLLRSHRFCRKQVPLDQGQRLAVGRPGDKYRATSFDVP